MEEQRLNMDRDCEMSFTFKTNKVTDKIFDNYRSKDKQNKINLQYVEDQTDEICLEAIKNDVESSKYIKK